MKMEQQRNISQRIGNAKNLLFYLALTLEIVILLIDKSKLINPIEGRMFQITFIITLVCVCLTKYTKREYLLIFCFCVLGFVVDQFTQRNEILRFVIFFAASKNVNLRSAMKYIFYVVSAGVLCLIILSVCNVLGEVAITTDYGRKGLETRYCLGLGHPNSLHCMVWALITLYLYLYDKYVKWYIYMFLLVLNISLYLLTVSRTGLIMGTFTILLYMLFHYIPTLRENTWVYVGGFFALLGGVALSLLAAMRGIQDHIVDVFDKAINGRMEDAFNRGNISMWSLFSTPNNNEYFDMGYVRLFYWYGIVPSIIFLFVLCIMIYYFYKKKDYAAFSMLTVFIIYTTIEAHAVSVYIIRNFALLLLIQNWNQVFGVEEKGKIGS